MSNPTDRPRASAGRRIGSACSALPLAVLIGLLAIVLGASPASAYWSSTGTGAAAGQTGTLAPPTGISVPTTAVTDVPVSWAAGTGGVTPEGYYVTRIGAATTNNICASSPTVLLTDTDCVDGDVPDGDYTYVVTAVFRSWTAPSAPSPTVAVVNPTQLAFLAQPTTTTAGAAIDPPVAVRLLSATGEAVAYAGIPITLTIGTNPSVGSLAGITTVLTAADGTATFANLTVDRAGVGYTLIALSPDLSPATSNPFTVLPPPPLGDASSYSVLGGAGVVNTLGTNISGDLGTAPTFVAAGFPPGTVGGDIHLGDADAVEALADAATAYTNLRALAAPVGNELSGNLNGLTLQPGVYHSTAALGVTGVVTLNGDADDVFIIQVDAAMGTAAGDQVILTGGAQAANVYWVVNGAVTLGAGTLFKGTILANGAITIGLATELIGRAFATGAVTMANNTIRFTTAPPPTLTIDGGTNVVTKDTTPDISGTTNAPAGTAVKVTVAGQTLTTTVRADGGWTVTAAALLASSYSIEAQVRDTAGNATKAFQTLVVEVNPSPVVLATAASFSVLSGGTATFNGPSHLSGDLGVDGSLSSIVADPAPTIDGVTHFQDATAAAAQASLQAAIADAQGRTLHTEFPGTLGGRTFHIGVHRAPAAAGLTGIVTLDGENNPNAVFIFQIGGALTAAAGCQVNLINGAQAANVFWVVNGAVGTGASCSFQGTLLATGAITLGAGTTLAGQALTQAAVTMASTDVTGPSPAVAARQSRSLPTASTSPSPSAMASPADPSPTSESTPTADPSPSVSSSPPSPPEASSDPSPSTGDQPEPTPTPTPSSEATISADVPAPTPGPAPTSPAADGAP